MDKKLTDNEIIKAFAICYTDAEEGCENCPMRDEEGFCMDAENSTLLNDVLDLLNRKDAEIEQLRDLVIEGGREQDRLIAEIERLKEKVKTTTENCTFVMRENEKATNKRFLEAIEVEKSKAIKEFAERVKQYRCVMGCGYDVVDVVNKLVKEMTEQNDFNRKG